MNFIKFLESMLLENPSGETSFIRSFFDTYKSNQIYDKTTLLVFADWLQDNDDPRVNLIRRCASLNNLNNEAIRSRMAGELGIDQNSVHLSVFNDAEWKRYWCVSPSDNPNLYFVFDGDGEPFWLSPEDFETKIPLSSINSESLSILFWNLMGYGWSLH